MRSETRDRSRVLDLAIGRDGGRVRISIHVAQPLWWLSIVFAVTLFFDLRDEDAVLETSCEVRLVLLTLELDFNLLRPRVLDVHAESGFG